MIHSHAMKTALRCLMHPLSVGAVLLLLLNDHFLKSTVPSVLTGKLSDFAGLFFFPFLLSLPSAVLAAPLRNARSVGAASFLITAVWFSVAKATVVGNAIMVDIVSAGITADPGHCF